MTSLLSLTLQRWKKLLYSYITSTIILYHKALGRTGVAASSGTLSITDNRTRRQYNIPIVNNSVKALDFLQITAAGQGADLVDHYENSIRILDKGFWNTACVETGITHIDGKRGYVQYRDYSIEDLFNKNDYEEVVFLLIWGKLPTPEEKHIFRKKLAAEMKPKPTVVKVIQSFPPDTLTFPMIMAAISAYTALDEGTQGVHGSSKPYYLGKSEAVDAAIIRTFAALATTAALVYCHKHGRQFTPADPDGSFIGNILLMMGRVEPGTHKPDQKLEKCLERLWILNADHGMTNSTSAFLSAASTLTDPLSCCIAATVAAYGPLHGAAIEIAYKDFENVGSVENVPKLIADVKAKKFRLFGYGHRIYKVVDPRGKLVRQLIDEYKEEVEGNHLLQVAMEIDRIAGDDPYFTSRNLKANADLYGCFLYTALGLETDIIVALVSLSRSAGVLAHWKESMSQTAPALWRPQHIFTGKVAKPKKE